MKRILPLGVFLLAGTITASASVDRGLLAMVPAGATMISSIDVAKSRNSEFGQYLLSKAEDQNFDEFIQQTGFDPRRDLQSVVIESSGAPQNQTSFAIFARGTFDQSKIRDILVRKGGVPATYEGVEMIIHKDHDEDIAFAFPGAGVAVMADSATMRQVIANRAMPTAVDAAMQGRISAIGTTNDAWFVSVKGSSFLARHLGGANGDQSGAQMQALQSIKEASGGLRFGPTVDVTFEATTRSAQDATSLADVVRFMSSMVQMQRQTDPRAGVLAAALDNMLLSTSGENMHLSVSLPEKSLEQMAELRPKMQTHVKPVPQQ